MNLILILFGLVSFASFVHCNTRVKRQVSFGFGIPNNNNNNNNPHASGQALGQAIGGTINNLLGGLGGLLGTNRPQGINPFVNQFQGNFGGCNANNGGCQQGCTLRRNRVQCYCNPGYVLQRDQVSCIDINECTLGPEKACQDKCVNTDGSFRCVCSNGILLQDGRSCGQAVQSCAVQNGGCEQDCIDKPKGGVRCKCTKGFALAEDQRSCLDTDECASGTHNCRPEQKCVNIAGGFQCTIDGASSCGDNNGGCEHRCVENKKGARCACRKGFELLGDGKSCEDIDECQTGLHNCPEICLNLPGKFECTTQEQQLGCSLNNGGCEQRCRDARKGVRCACLKGFVLHANGKNCVSSTVTPTDPCEVDNGGCPQICVNKGGTPSCQCEEGFKLVNNLCQREIIQPPSPVQSSPPPPIPPDQKGCGVNTKKSLFRRIVGGKPADPKDWPWMAAILKNAATRQFCGGTLITDRHILTAAHCVVAFKKEDIFVRLGEYNFDTPDENNPTEFRVEDIKMHTGYSQVTQENDIAILKLSRPSSFSEYIWPVCLPPPNNDFVDQLGYVTGWGTIHFGGPVSNVLQEVVIPVWKQSDCVAAYTANKVTDSMMCAGLKEGGKDSCQGDSGGPFLIQIFPETKWHVAGIVSWGIECASANRPGVYTRVNKYLDWIKENSVF